MSIAKNIRFVPKRTYRGSREAEGNRRVVLPNNAKRTISDRPPLEFSNRVNPSSFKALLLLTVCPFYERSETIALSSDSAAVLAAWSPLFGSTPSFPL